MEEISTLYQEKWLCYMEKILSADTTISIADFLKSLHHNSFKVYLTANYVTRKKKICSARDMLSRMKLGFKSKHIKTMYELHNFTSKEYNLYIATLGVTPLWFDIFMFNIIIRGIRQDWFPALHKSGLRLSTPKLKLQVGDMYNDYWFRD